MFIVRAVRGLGDPRRIRAVRVAYLRWFRSGAGFRSPRSHPALGWTSFGRGAAIREVGASPASVGLRPSTTGRRRMWQVFVKRRRDKCDVQVRDFAGTAVKADLQGQGERAGASGCRGSLRPSSAPSPPRPRFSPPLPCPRPELGW